MCYLQSLGCRKLWFTCGVVHSNCCAFLISTRLQVEGGRQNKNRFNGFSQTATEPKKEAVKTARLT